MRIVAVTAVRAESRALLAALRGTRRLRGRARPTWGGRAGSHEVIVIQGGIGSDAAARAVAALDAGCDVVLSFGFAGGLVAGLEPGAIVLPTAVVWETPGAVTRRALTPSSVVPATVLPEDLRKTAAAGGLLSSPIVLATPAAKADAGRRTDTVAVEMETAALATWADARGVRLAVLRAILDPLHRSLADLPPDLDHSWRARARLATMPRVWPLLADLRRDAMLAARALTRAAAVALPRMQA